METTLALPSKSISAIPHVPEQRQIIDTKVAVVQALDRSATLPSDKAFVAQVVTARLSGTEFPENPGEIAPEERKLKPYNVQMLPYESPEPIEKAEADDDIAEMPVLARDGSERTPADGTRTERVDAFDTVAEVDDAGPKEPVEQPVLASNAPQGDDDTLPPA